jgi:hypothetical protein
MQLWDRFSTKPPSFPTRFCHRWVIRCTPLLENFCPYFGALCFISMSSAKCRPSSASFTGPNTWQSEGARSGLWAGWGRTVQRVFAIASLAHELVWGRALSWRRRTSFMFRLDRTLLMRYRTLFSVSFYRSWCNFRNDPLNYTLFPSNQAFLLLLDAPDSNFLLTHDPR